MSLIPSDHLRSTTELLEPAKSILIVLPPELNIDTVAAGLSFYLALSATGKQVSIFCPSPMTVQFNQLIGVDKIVNSIGGNQGRNLIISFPYQEGSIEKVSYNIEQDTFNLVIEPREGYPMITAENIRFSYGGSGQPDLLISIGVSKFADLQNSLGANASLIEAKPLISIDNNPRHERMGKVDLVVPSSSSNCEIITDLLTALSLRMDADIAANLLAGITEATNNFSSPSTSAQTFETAALLSRSGARKPQISSAPTMPNMPMQRNQQPPFPKQMPQVQNHMQRPSFPGQPPMQQQWQSSAKPFSFPQQSLRQQGSMPQQHQQPQPTQSNQQQSPQQSQPETPSDWLKPKIYKGSTLV